MTAKFILSFDCEGKWGIADRLNDGAHTLLSDERLRGAYASILSLLEEFEMSATFAFVGTFSLSNPELLKTLPALSDLAQIVPGYFEAALSDITHGTRQGWTGDWAVESVALAQPKHEIGLHGATHLPWNWPGMSSEIARREMSILFDSGAQILPEASTFIYPRNAVAFPEVLDHFGIAGYRLQKPHSNRLMSLASEFNLLETLETYRNGGRPIGIPAGYFLNWLSGVRRLVPTAVSLRRAQSLVQRANASAATVHYWTHPENIATSPDTLGLLRGLVEMVARERDAGRCAVYTQDEWCREMDQKHVDACNSRRSVLFGGG